MIARACRSSIYHFSSRNIRAIILFGIAIGILIAARDYLHSAPPKVTYKKHKTVPAWNPAHSKDLFLVPGVRPKAHHVAPVDRTKVLEKLAKAANAPIEHPLLAFQRHPGIQRSKQDTAMVEYIADKVKVEIAVLTNLESNLTCWFQITLTNLGTATISYGNWEIYFHSIRFLQQFNFPYPDGVLIKESPFRLFHVEGSLYRLVPEESEFSGWGAGAEVNLHLEAKAFLISRSDFFPNWYVSAPKVTPLLLQSTINSNMTFVHAFDTENQWKRRTNDRYNPFTAEDRFNRNLVIRDLGHPGSYVIPTPVKTSLHPIKKVTMDRKTWKIIHNEKFFQEARYLADLLKLEVSSVKPRSNFILFTEETVVPLKHLPTTVDEAYTLNVDPVSNSITLAASHTHGAFYAAITLYRIAHQIPSELWEVPVGEIRDQPRFGYRGLHLDVARNFHPKDEVLRLLDVMAIYKLNKLHIHLSDDEGWRIEIQGLPELTQVGSRRCHGGMKNKCLFPALGSGPDPVYPSSGYYTVNDYREILRHAELLHIQIIPEIDMPGHSQAAITAMEARYHDLHEKGQGLEAREYLLSDLADKSIYLSAQSFTKTALNPCLESTYTFLRHVMKSLKVMHSDIQPLTFYHFGGDEVPSGAWINSTACLSSSLQPEVDNPQKWKEYFLARIAKMAEQESLDLGVWEDGIIDQKTSIPFNGDLLGAMSGHIYSYPWDNKWESGRGNQAIALANAGYKVVLSQGTHLYFDHAQEPDPEEVGLYWATRFIDLHRVFAFMPEQIYWNADFSVFGEPITKEEICNGRDCLTLHRPENYVGMECHLWGELLRSRDITDHQMFPRVIAMAERAWHRAPWEGESDAAARRIQMEADWSRFANTIGYTEFPYLDSLGIKYRVPPPGAVVQNKKLLVNSDSPGLEIQYSLDFGNTWRDARGGPELTGDATIFLRTMSSDRKRWSRIIKLQYDHDQVKVKQRAMDGQINEQKVEQMDEQNQQNVMDGQIQQRTMDGQIQQRAMDEQIQQRTVDGQIQQRAMDGQIQQRTVDGQIQQKAVDEQIEQNVMGGQIQQRAMDGQNKLRAMDEQIQQRAMNEQIQQRAMDGQIQQRTVDGQIQHNVMDGQIQHNVMGGQIQQRAMDGQIQQRAMDEQIQQRAMNGQIQDNVMDGQIQQRTVNGQIQDNVMGGQIQQRVMDGQIQQRTVNEQIQHNVMGGQIQQRVMDGQIQQRAMDGQIQQRNMDGQIQDPQQGGFNSVHSRQIQPEKTKLQNYMEKSLNPITQDTLAVDQSSTQRKSQTFSEHPMKRQETSLQDQHPIKRQERSEILPEQFKHPMKIQKKSLPDQHPIKRQKISEFSPEQFKHPMKRQEISQNQIGNSKQQTGKIQFVQSLQQNIQQGKMLQQNKQKVIDMLNANGIKKPEKNPEVGREMSLGTQDDKPPLVGQKTVGQGLGGQPAQSLQRSINAIMKNSLKSPKDFNVKGSLLKIDQSKVHLSNLLAIRGKSKDSHVKGQR